MQTYCLKKHQVSDLFLGVGVTISEIPALQLPEWGSLELPVDGATSSTYLQLVTSASLSVSAFYHKTPSVKAAHRRLIRPRCMSSGYMVTWKTGQDLFFSSTPRDCSFLQCWQEL